MINTSYANAYKEVLIVLNNLNENIMNETKGSMQIVEYKEQRWYEKLFAKILKIFKKN